MSTVILDTITGKSTATTITIGSTPVVSASANSMTIRGEGSAQTSIQQGLCKAWSNIRYDSSAPNFTNGDSFNASSVADTAVGELTVTLSNNMANSVYACVASTQDFAVEHQSPTLTTSTYGIRTIADSSGARADVGNGTFVATIITGDLA